MCHSCPICRGKSDTPCHHVTGQTVTFCTHTKGVFHLIHKFAYCLQFYNMKIVKHNDTLHYNYQAEQQSCIIQSLTGTQTSSDISYAV